MQLDELNMIETILSVFLGGALSVITTLLQNKHQRNSELLKDKLGRQVEYSLYQRKTLLRLQENFYLLGRLVSAVHLNDVEVYKKTGIWADNNIDEQLDSELMKTVRMISIDIDRVADDTTREKLKRYKALWVDVTQAKSEQMSLDLYNEALSLWEGMFDHIGVELRKTYLIWE